MSIKAEYWQRGEAIDYTNPAEASAKIDANEIVTIGSHIGVAGAPIAPGETGTLHVFGVFEMPKSSENAIAIGTNVYFDGTGITEAADNGKQDNDLITYPSAGYATEAAAAADTTIKVRLV